MLYGVEGEVAEDAGPIPFGQANVCRQGSDVTIIAFSKMVYSALEAAETLAEKGISAEVIDPRTVMPLDMDTILTSVKRPITWLLPMRP